MNTTKAQPWFWFWGLWLASLGSVFLLAKVIKFALQWVY